MESKKSDLIRVSIYLAAVIVPTIKKHDGVVGITLNGGLARDYADHLSEIDITLFLSTAVYRKWVGNNQSALPMAKRPYETIYELNDVLYDIKYVDYQEQQQIEWEQVALWDASYAEILHDPNHLIQELYKSKLGKTPDLTQTKKLIFACWWHYHQAGNIWIHRGDIPQGHLMLTEAVKSVLQALFLVNNEYIPHEKWIVHMSRTLSWLPDNWNERIAQAMTAANDGSGDLIKRQSVIADIHLEVENYLNSDYRTRPFPDMKSKMDYLTNCHARRRAQRRMKMSAVSSPRTRGSRD